MNYFYDTNLPILGLSVAVFLLLTLQIISRKSLANAVKQLFLEQKLISKKLDRLLAGSSTSKEVTLPINVVPEYPDQKKNREIQETIETKIYVGNVNHNTTEKDLHNLFAEFGDIDMINIPINRYNGKSKGYGFVTFVSAKAARSAIDSLNGIEFNGRNIQLNYAKVKN